MIDIKVKIHDKFTFEFKISFITGRNSNDNAENLSEFSINTWLFVPNSLDINRASYSKEQFYKDVKSNVRLITPTYNLQDIYERSEGPFKRLKESFFNLSANPASPESIDEFTYQVRLFSCICKSAMRDKAYQIIEIEDDKEIVLAIDDYINDVKSIVKSYRDLIVVINLPDIQHEQKEFFMFGDDFIGNLLEQQIYRILRGLKSHKVYNKIKTSLVNLLEEEIVYRKLKGYSLPDKDNTSENYLVIMRRGILKKLMESDLYLITKKTEDGAFVRQVYYGLAAGVAMIFSTIIAFTAQIRYGNFTTPLFLALVISYIFKDRIKDMMRYYFSTQLGRKYYDTKRELVKRNETIGWVKEAFDFVKEDKVPVEVLNLRKRSPLVEAESRIYNEQIILYKKLVNLSSFNINKNEYYRFNGINDITRFNITHYVQKADDPFVSLYIPEKNDGFVNLKSEKVYAIHFILRCESKTEVYYRKFRLLFNRDGIKEIKEISN